MSTEPTQGAAEVPTSGAITLTFSEPMDTASLEIEASPAAAFGTATWSAEDKVARLEPSSPLAFSTAYSLTINARDVAGNALPEATLAFGTEAEPDTTAPAIASTTPAAGATGIWTTTGVSVTFSERMDPATVSLALEPAVTLGEATWDAEYRTVSATPASALAEMTTYRVTVAGKDPSGNALAGSGEFSFETGDFTAPVIVATVPAEGSTVGASTPLSISFSEAMDPASITVELAPAASLDAPTWSADQKTVSFQPAEPLLFETGYVATIGGRDRKGNALAASTLSFSVGPQPTVASTSPTHEATVVGTKEPIEIVFAQPMDVASVVVGAVAGTTTYELGLPTWSADQKTVRFAAPPSPFAYSTSYTVTVDGNDEIGDEIATTQFSFTVTARPAVASTIPTGNATGVDINGRITLSFNVPMNRASVEGAFSVTPAFTCGWAWSSDSTMASCIPMAPLAFGTRYTVSLAASALGATGDQMAAAHSFSFTTASAPDKTPPTVVAVSPANTSGSARRNTSITITFSEEMDRALTETAFAITAPTGMTGGTFSWNTAGTLMSYNPPTDFLHGAQVAWSLSIIASDKNGNRMTAPATASFRVVKQGVFELAPVTTAGVNGSMMSSSGSIEATPPFKVGDLSTGAYSRAFVTFDLAAIPFQLVAITEAKLKVSFTYEAIKPTGLGKLWAQSVNYGPELSFADFTVPIDALPCPPGTQYCFYQPRRYDITTTLSSRQVTVTDKVQYDLSKSDRQKRSQFRIAFDTGTDNDSTADLLKVQPLLITTYEYAW